MHLGKIKFKYTETHFRVRAVQFSEAGSLQEPLSLRNWLRSRGFDSGWSRSVGERQRAGCPPAHTWAELICIEPHRRVSFRHSSWNETQNTSSLDSLHPNRLYFTSFFYYPICYMGKQSFQVVLGFSGWWGERMQWMMLQRTEFWELPKG